MRIRCSASALLLLTLFLLGAAGCGGGGGRKPVMAPPPIPAPPPPPPPPSGMDFRTSEFQASPALERINVVPAYERGATGSGVLIGVIDTGIDVNNVEFAGRIDSRSADLVRPGVVSSADLRPGGPNLQDVDGHGTSVAGIIAAAKNDLGMHGVAFNATLLAFRGDEEGDSETIFGEVVAEGVRRSAAAGARVINLSLGTDEAGARAEFDFYFDIASGNDIFVAIAAGNESGANPQESALAATDPAARGSVIIVGAVDGANQIASFSNRAGSAAAFYLVAPGTRIPTPTLGGGAGAISLFSGTSAATPFVSGAAALIRQLWPQLTAAEVADILLTSATDLGAPGVDAIFGHGLLNVGAAVAPLGSTTTSSVSGVTLEANAPSFAAGPAFGSTVPDFGDFVFLDDFGRDFRGSLNDLVAGRPDLRADPIGFMQPFSRTSFAATPIGAGTARFRMETDDLAFTDPIAALRASSATAYSETSDTLSVAFTQRLTDNVDYLVAFGFAPREIDVPLAGAARRLARDAFTDAYLPASSDGFASALRWRLTRTLDADILVSHASREDRFDAFSAFGGEAGAPDTPQSNIRLGLTKTLPGGAVRLESGLAHEEGGLFGAVFAGPFGTGASSTTFYQSGAVDLAIAGGWRAQARGAVGFTTNSADGGEGFLAGVRNLSSTQFSIGAYRQGLLADSDRFALSVSQPLRIESGSAHLIVPTRYDYLTRTLVFEDRFAPLSGGVRELDIEAAYSMATRFGYVDVNLLRQFNVTAGGQDATTGVVRANFPF